MNQINGSMVGGAYFQQHSCQLTSNTRLIKGSRNSELIHCMLSKHADPHPVMLPAAKLKQTYCDIEPGVASFKTI